MEMVKLEELEVGQEVMYEIEEVKYFWRKGKIKRIDPTLIDPIVIEVDGNERMFAQAEIKVS